MGLLRALIPGSPNGVHWGSTCCVVLRRSATSLSNVAEGEDYLLVVVYPHPISQAPKLDDIAFVYPIAVSIGSWSILQPVGVHISGPPTNTPVCSTFYVLGTTTPDDTSNVSGTLTS